MRSTIELSASEKAALAKTLAQIGETPAVAARLVEGFDDDLLRRDWGDGVTCHALLISLVTASMQLGRVAHTVLHHPPGAGEDFMLRTSQLTGGELLAQLCFLREHIVSTVAQQGAQVWFAQTPDGRSLLAFAEDVAQQDAFVLLQLRAGAMRVRL